MRRYPLFWINYFRVVSVTIIRIVWRDVKSFALSRYEPHIYVKVNLGATTLTTSSVSRWIVETLYRSGMERGEGKRKGWMEARVLRQHSDVQTSKHLDLSGSGRLCRVSRPCRAATTAAAATRVPLILLSSGYPLTNPLLRLPSLVQRSPARTLGSSRLFLSLSPPPSLSFSFSGILAFLTRRCSW